MTLDIISPQKSSIRMPMIPAKARVMAMVAAAIEIAPRNLRPAILVKAATKTRIPKKQLKIFWQNIGQGNVRSAIARTFYDYHVKQATSSMSNAIRENFANALLDGIDSSDLDAIK